LKKEETGAEVKGEKKSAGGWGVKPAQAVGTEHLMQLD
jgi:hypothetical protein